MVLSVGPTVLFALASTSSRKSIKESMISLPFGTSTENHLKFSKTTRINFYPAATLTQLSPRGGDVVVVVVVVVVGSFSLLQRLVRQKHVLT